MTAPSSLNVADTVEGLVLACGLPYIPKAYVIESDALNAFATGRDPQHSLIGVTTGLLSFTEKQAAQAKQLWLKAGEKMLFDGGSKGIALDRDRLALKVVEAGDPDVLIHDPTNRSIAHMLVEMPHEGFPVALGVLYEDPAPTFESAVVEQNRAAASGKTPDLQALVSKGQTWQVEKEPREL